MTDTPFLETTLSLQAQVEALLFVAPGAVSPMQLATVLKYSVREIETALEELENTYRTRGFRLQWHQGQVLMTSAPEAGILIEQFLGLQAYSRLSKAALETLAIIAYQQPVTRPEIDAIRGVNSDGVLKSLLSKGLIQESGRAERVGRPILYTTTAEFLMYFGLNSLTELPPLIPPEESPSPGTPIDVLKT